ncbi:conserved hypothetical protein [Paenibacillus curdlanolyticus YK9]|uniref:Uncharacterized protein n=1 Tax=Paenibacillus curdlanolyticus YK9 TaxID=717606 RepID=E0I626_9BACL|nr:hypothetical protein [Paenibacillus curdlanolyticus]EFM12418.1 conserved hypothetical protein [Paenibacillus curdlanolyticus YK9]
MRDNIQVPYGYEPPAEASKGTLIYYDSFEDTTEEDLEAAAALKKQMGFRKLVLYPLHEATGKRMFDQPISPYYKREDRLHEWRREQADPTIVVEGLEGKRKKYTPFESAMRHLTETYPSPYFVYVTPEMANLLASYATFEEWIVKLRLILSEEPSAAQLHPRLQKFAHRWRVAEFDEI